LAAKPLQTVRGPNSKFQFETLLTLIPSAPTQATYILDLDTLTWSQPSPSVNLPQLTQIPPRRSQALGGADIFANARQAFIMFGGQGSDGQPLDDIWVSSLNLLGMN
jgi:hypothetical protein